MYSCSNNESHLPLIDSKTANIAIVAHIGLIMFQKVSGKFLS